MTEPSELRALADRVCAEEPSAELAWAVKRVMPDDVWARAFSPLHNLSDAAAMMPAGWFVEIIHWFTDGRYETAAHNLRRRVEAKAPTEPRARTALACRVRAAVMEDGE